jgi:excisionase family DNA binding protein
MQALTTKEAAERLGIKRMTVIHNIRRGAIKATRFGPSYVIDPAEVERYAAERKAVR